MTDQKKSRFAVDLDEIERQVRMVEKGGDEFSNSPSEPYYPSSNEDGNSYQSEQDYPYPSQEIPLSNWNETIYHSQSQQPILQDEEHNSSLQGRLKDPLSELARIVGQKDPFDSLLNKGGSEDINYQNQQSHINQDLSATAHGNTPNQQVYNSYGAARAAQAQQRSYSNTESGYGIHETNQVHEGRPSSSSQHHQGNYTDFEASGQQRRGTDPLREQDYQQHRVSAVPNNSSYYGQQQQEPVNYTTQNNHTISQNENMNFGNQIPGQSVPHYPQWERQDPQGTPPISQQPYYSPAENSNAVLGGAPVYPARETSFGYGNGDVPSQNAYPSQNQMEYPQGYPIDPRANQGGNPFPQNRSFPSSFEDDDDYDEYDEDKKRSRWPFLIAGLFSLLIVGTGSYFFMKSDGEIKETPIITADSDPVKIIPDGGANSDNTDMNSSIYGDSQDAQVKVVDRQEQPVDLENTVRIISPDSSSLNNSGNQGVLINVDRQIQEREQNFALQMQSPNKVRSQPLTVRSDGTVVFPEAENVNASENSAPKQTADGVRSIDLSANNDSSDSQEPEPTVQEQRNEPAREIQTSKNTEPETAEETPIVPDTAPRSREPLQLQRPQNVASANTNTSNNAIASGSYTVQLGIANSETEAMSRFEALQRRFPNELGSESPIIRRAEVNGTAIYRIRISAGSRESALNFCARLSSAGGDCFVSRN